MEVLTEGHRKDVIDSHRQLRTEGDADAESLEKAHEKELQ
jgi:hypothetical protein